MIVDLSYISNPISFATMAIIAAIGLTSCCAALALHADFYDKKKKILSYVCAVIATLSCLTFGAFSRIDKYYVIPNRRDALKSYIEEQYKARAIFEEDKFYLFDENGNSRGTVIVEKAETPGKYVICKTE